MGSGKDRAKHDGGKDAAGRPEVEGGVPSREHEAPDPFPPEREGVPNEPHVRQAIFGAPSEDDVGEYTGEARKEPGEKG